MKKSKSVFNIVTALTIMLLIGAVIAYRSGKLNILHHNTSSNSSADSLSYHEPDTGGALVDSADHIMPPTTPEVHKKPIQTDQYDPENAN
ncbi:MAG TPA: hypothetical protein VL947_05455 [Cytophagales bacterium]|nr:hypothetical protein [Cytophagales bacterium]